MDLAAKGCQIKNALCLSTDMNVKVSIVRHVRAQIVHNDRSREVESHVFSCVRAQIVKVLDSIESHGYCVVETRICEVRCPTSDVSPVEVFDVGCQLIAELAVESRSV